MMKKVKLSLIVLLFVGVVVSFAVGKNETFLIFGGYRYLDFSATVPEIEGNFFEAAVWANFDEEWLIYCQAGWGNADITLQDQTKFTDRDMNFLDFSIYKRVATLKRDEKTGDFKTNILVGFHYEGDYIDNLDDIKERTGRIVLRKAFTKVVGNLYFGIGTADWGNIDYDVLEVGLNIKVEDAFNTKNLLLLGNIGYANYDSKDSGFSDFDKTYFSIGIAYRF